MFQFKFMQARMNEDTGAEMSAAGAESSSDETGTTGEEATTPAAEGEPSAKEFAFNKRLEAEREKIRNEYAEKYKDYDVYREIGEYVRESNNFSDVMSLKEQIEMERLQARAEAEGIPPDVQRRLEQLEAKAQEGEKLKEQQQLNEFYRGFRNDLSKFVEGKGVEADALENYMIENKINSMDVAYRAMKYEDVEAQKAEISKKAVEEYINSKRAPRAEGGGAAGRVIPDAPKTFAEARVRAAEMMRNARQPQ